MHHPSVVMDFDPTQTYKIRELLDFEIDDQVPRLLSDSVSEHLILMRSAVVDRYNPTCGCGNCRLGLSERPKVSALHTEELLHRRRVSRLADRTCAHREPTSGNRTGSANASCALYRRTKGSDRSHLCPRARRLLSL
jgi:hypothetical protein